MNKQDLLKIQSCILKVNIHCDGCEHKVKKLLQKIDGVYSVSIDAEQGKVVVSGNVEPAKLIKKLKSSGKHAELWGGQRGMMFPFPNNNQLKQLQSGHGKGGKDNKSHHGGKEQGKGGGQPQFPHLQNKGPKDLKVPSKGHKSVKFNLPEEDFDGSDDGFDELNDYDKFDDDYDDDDDDEDEEEFGHGHGHAMPNKMMPPMAGMMMNGRGPHGPPMNGNNKGHGGGGGAINAKKGDVMDLPVQFKDKGGNNEFKNGGKKNKGDGGKKDKHGKGGGQNKSSGGLLGKLLGFGQKSSKGGGHDTPKNKNKGSGGGGGGNNKGKEGKKGGGKFEGHHIDDDFDVPQHGKGGKGGKGNNNGNMGQMGPNPMNHIRNVAAVQGLPAAMNGGYYQGMQTQPPPPQYHPQQQYMPMMMNHNQQNQQHMNHMYPPMMYGRPYMPAPPMPPPLPVHPAAEPYVFSDENTESCNIM